MKKIVFFELKFCPYCRQAHHYIEELQAENANYKNIEIEVVNERVEKARANSYDYYYVPSFYIDEVKIHEGVVANKSVMEEILKKALD